MNDTPFGMSQAVSLTLGLVLQWRRRYVRGAGEAFMSAQQDRSQATGLAS